MTRYTVQIYTTDGDMILGTRIECSRKDVPRKLAGIVVDYLRDNPYPGTIQALVNVGWNYTTYLIQLKNNTVTAYRYVFQCNMAEVQE